MWQSGADILCYFIVKLNLSVAWFLDDSSQGDILLMASQEINIPQLHLWTDVCIFLFFPISNAKATRVCDRSCSAVTSRGLLSAVSKTKLSLTGFPLSRQIRHRHKFSRWNDLQLWWRGQMAAYSCQTSIAWAATTASWNNLLTLNHDWLPLSQCEALGHVKLISGWRILVGTFMSSWTCSAFGAFKCLYNDPNVL